MTDAIGSTTIPLVAPSAGQASGDPLLSYTASFVQAIANAYCLTAWQSLRPSTLPVKTAIVFDPTRKRSFFFDDAWLPAIFVWRQKTSKRRQVAQDIRVKYGTIGMLWVPPIAQTDRPDLAARAPFGNGLFDTIDDYFEIGRDPVWTIAGDTNPSAGDVTTYGSSFPFWAGFRRMYLDTSEPIEIDIARSDESARTYDAWMATFHVEEQLTIGNRATQKTGSLDAQILTPDGQLLVVEGGVPAPT